MVRGAPSADPDRLLEHVRALEGERHPRSSPEALGRAVGYVEERLADVGLAPSRHPFRHRGRTWHNVSAAVEGREPSRPRVLIGAHVDTVSGCPGADDNASGVAGLLEAARILAEGVADPGGAPRAADSDGGAGRPAATIELVAFNLEEQQGWTYRVGSRAWTERARKADVEYAGALVLEMIGYRNRGPDSQRIPLAVRWMDLRRTGDFVAAVADGKSKPLLEIFEGAAAAVRPGLPVETLHAPLRGWAVWQTRLSDNASFWSAGYPSLMVTDTAFLRNPHYHRRSDRLGTLDPEFMAAVTDVVVETARRLAG